MKNKNKLLTFAALFTSATFIVHIINKAIPASASLKEILDNSQTNTYNWRFGKIHYSKKGKGSPILLIHDTLPGSSGYEWHRIENQLAMEHTVYNIDLLGYGSSEKPGITYTNFVYTQLICDFVKNIIGEKTDIISSGFSCSFAVMACRNEGTYFDKLMFINPPSMNRLKQMPSKKDKMLKCLLEIPVFGTLVYHIVVSHENLNNTFIEKLNYNPFHVDNDMIDAYYEASHIGGAYAKSSYACFASKYMNINISQNLKTIDNSILIVKGETECNSDSIVDNYCTINPAIETVTIEKSKHFPHIENVESFLDQVGVFF